jgi:hypothetical protein
MNRKHFGCAKRTLAVAAVLIVLAALPAFCGFRFDTGLYVLLNVGPEGNEGFPFAPLDAHYQFELGSVKIGLGLNALTAVILTIWWPDLYAQVNLGPLAVEGHFGVTCFGSFLGFGMDPTGPVMELSAWLMLGKTFRLGGGGIMITAPGPGTDIFFYFVGVKLVSGDA